MCASARPRNNGGSRGDPSAATRLDQVDWETVYQCYWRDEVGDMDRQRRKQAEFLMPDMKSNFRIRSIFAASLCLSVLVINMVAVDAMTAFPE